MSLLCRFGLHNFDILHGRRATKDEPALPMCCRCTRCGRETKGWHDKQDIPGATVKFSGHLSARDVRRIRRQLKRLPAYVSPQVEAELAAEAAARQARKKRGPTEVTAIRRSA